MEVGDRRSPKIRLLWAIGVFWAGLYLYVPILAPYVSHQGGSNGMVGLAVAAYGVPQLTTRIFLGRLADRLGHRHIFLMLGMTTVTASSLGMVLWPVPWAFVGFRILAGLAASTWAMFSMLYVSYQPVGRDVRSMGWVSFANNAGQVTASVVGGYLVGRWGWSAPFWGSAALGVIGFLLVAKLPEKRWAERRRGKTPFRRLLTHRPLKVAAGLGIFGQMVTFLTTFGYVPLWAVHRSVPRDELGLLMLAGILPTMLFSVITGNWLSKRWSVRTLSWLGFAMMGCCSLLTPVSRGTGWLFATQAGLGVGRGMVSPSLMAMAIMGVPDRWRTTALAVYQASYAAGMIGGPALAAFTVGQLGLRSVFWLAGIASLLGTGMSIMVPARNASTLVAKTASSR